jgi:hypothetical protein
MIHQRLFIQGLHWLEVMGDDSVSEISVSLVFFRDHGTMSWIKLGASPELASGLLDLHPGGNAGIIVKKISYSRLPKIIYY